MKRSAVISLHLLFWTVASIIPHLVLLASSPNMPHGLIIYQTATQLYYIAVFYFIYLFISPMTIESSRKLTTVIIIFGVSVVFLFFLKLGKVIMIDSKYALNLTQYGVYSPGHYASDILYIIFYSAFAILIKMIVRWYDARKAADEKMIQDHRFELELLKAQLNPHFFFNTLNNIYSLVYKKSDEAPAALMKMSDIMRYMLYESKAEKVPLDKELEYLEDYIELQRLRFTDPGFIEYSVAGDTGNQFIPPMMLLSFVENAFKHGKKRVSNPGIIIRISASEKLLNFIVSNYVIENPVQEAHGHTGIGLKNIKRRLELLYPNSHDLTIITKDGRFTVNLNIYPKS
ncbi:MAG TPA: sensor histidine kinase [Bacteroidales bacterium]|nr:sensor histidine kinase [Bacteroidales bacterium]